MGNITREQAEQEMQESRICECSHTFKVHTMADSRFGESALGVYEACAVNGCPCNKFSERVKLQAFEGGATRSHKAERRELIPKEAIDALARRLALGAEKHGEGNWKLGGEDFRKATINHLLDRIFEYIENGNVNDANTDAIICNAAFLCWYEEKNPRRVSAEEQHFKLPSKEWKAFLDILDQEAISNPTLRKLLTEPSVLDSPK